MAVNYWSIANRTIGAPAVWLHERTLLTMIRQPRSMSTINAFILPAADCAQLAVTQRRRLTTAIALTWLRNDSPLLGGANADDGTCDTPSGLCRPRCLQLRSRRLPDRHAARAYCGVGHLATHRNLRRRLVPLTPVYVPGQRTDSYLLPSNTGCAYGGCMTVGAPTYNPSATYDDGSCGAVSYGCTDSNALNYAAGAQADDGTCAYAAVVVYGCVESAATNYNPSATPSAYASPCTYGGCTDSELPEYNPSATFNDGSCPVRRPGCADSRADDYNAVYNIHRPSSCTFSGCTNSIATNYDPTATLDDASCVIPPAGCKPAHGALPPEDDGSCVTIGCRDPRAITTILLLTRRHHLRGPHHHHHLHPPPSPPSTPPAFPPRSTSSGAVASVALIGGRGWPPTPRTKALAAVAGLGDLDGMASPMLLLARRARQRGGALHGRSSTTAVAPDRCLSPSLPAQRRNHFGSAIAALRTVMA